MDTLIIFTRSTVETFHLPSSLVVVSQWVTYIFFLLVVVYCVAHCVISDTSYVSVWFYKQRIIHAQRNANMYLQRYVFIQKQIERGNFSAKNNEFEIADMRYRMYAHALKNLQYEVQCGLLHLRKPYRRTNAVVANAFFYEVVDESLDAIEIIINYDNSNADDIFESKFYDFFKEALCAIQFDTRKKACNLDLEKIQRIAHTAAERHFEKVHKELIELVIVLQ